jgi:LemA protein
MERDGVITPEQADLLRRSLGPVPGAERSATATPEHPNVWLVLTIALAVIVAGFILVIAAGGGSEGIDTVSDVLNQPEKIGDMNRSLSGILTAGSALALVVILLAVSYNGLISKEEAVFGAWADVESTLQRRADLIPSLVETVSGYVEHERETLESVAEIRGRAIDRVAGNQAELREALDSVDKLESESALAAVQKASTEVDAALMEILALAEDYPELRASDQFLELQGQLEGTENRINVARLRFNETVERFNGAIRRVPGSLLAGLGGFRRKAYFKADEGSAAKPEVEF